MKRCITLQILLWICTVLLFVPRVWAQQQEDKKLVSGKYFLGSTQKAFTNTISLEKALEGAKLPEITELELTGGKFEKADWEYLESKATSFTTLKKLHIASTMDEVAAMSSLSMFAALKEATVAKVEALELGVFPAAIERITMPDCKDVRQRATENYKSLKELYLPRLNAFGQMQFYGCDALQLLVLGENENKNAVSVNQFEGEDWRDNLFKDRHPKLTFSAADGSDLSKEKYDALVKLYKEVEDGDTNDNFWWGFEIAEYVANTKYTLSCVVEPSAGGSIEVSPAGTSFKEGTLITLNVKHNHGYQFQKLELFKSDTPTEAVAMQNNAFTMPACNVTAKATFTQNTLKVQFSGNAIDQTYTGVDMAAILAQLTGIDKAQVTKITFLAGTFDATDYKTLSDKFATEFTGITAIEVGADVAHYELAAPGTQPALPATIKSITLANLKTVPNKLFENAQMETLHLPQTTTLGFRALAGCTKLVNLDAPLLTTLENSACEGCTALATLKVLNLTTVKESAFKGCTAFAALTLCGEKLPQVGNNVFEGCAATRDLSLVKADGSNYTKEEIHGLHKTFDGEDGIADGVWYGWKLPQSGLYEITYGDGTSSGSVDHGRLSGKRLAAENELVKVEVTPDPGFQFLKLYYKVGSETIESTTKEFTMPAANITVKAVFQVIDLTIAVNGSTTTYAGNGLVKALEAAGFPKAKFGEIEKLEFVAGAFQDWNEWGDHASKFTKLTSFTIKKEVGLGNMSTNTPIFATPKLTTVVIEAELAAVADNAFAGAPELTTVRLLKTQSVGDAAFANCTKLTNIELPALISTGFGKKLFMGCTALTKVGLPSEVTSISESAFQGCKNLTSIPNHQKIETVGENAFEGCEALTEIHLPALTSLGESAFKECKGMTKVECPLLETFGENAFEGCIALSKLEMPELTEIEMAGLLGCTALTELSLKKLTTIKENGLQGCSGLKTLILPALTTIEKQGLKGCVALTKLDLPALETIEENGLEGCAELMTLKTLKLNGVGEKAFAGCTKLATLILGMWPEGYTNGASEECAAGRKIVIIPDAEAFDDILAKFVADTENYEEDTENKENSTWDGWKLPTEVAPYFSMTVSMKKDSKEVEGAVVTLMDENGAVLEEAYTNAEGKLYFTKGAGTYKYNVIKEGCAPLMNQTCTVVTNTGENMEVKLAYISYKVSFKTDPTSSRGHVEWMVTKEGSSDNIADANGVANGVSVNSGDLLTINVAGKDGYEVTKLVIEGEDEPLDLTECKKTVTKDLTFVASVSQKKYTVTYAMPTNGSLLVKNDDATVNSGTLLNSNVLLSLTATPKSGYKLSKFVAVVDGMEKELATAQQIGSKDPVPVSYKLEGNVNFVVEFQLCTYTVSYETAPDNGSLVVKNATGNVVSTGTSLDANTELTVVVKPESGYELDKLTAHVDGVTNDLLLLQGESQETTTKYTLVGNVTFTATFKTATTGGATKYTVTYKTVPTDGSYGKLVVATGTTTINSGIKLAENTSLSLTATPTAGYRLRKFVAVVNGAENDLATTTKGSTQPVMVPYSLKADVEFVVEFEPIPATKYTVTYTAAPANGTVVVKNGATVVASGDQVEENTLLSIILTPTKGYKVKSAVAKVEGKSDTKLHLSENTADKTFAANYGLEANVTFEVEFEAIENLVSKFTVTYTAKPENGTVAVKNGTEDVVTGSKVDKNTNLTLILTPAEGYKVKSAVAKVEGQEDKTLDLTANTTDKTFSATYKLEANVTFVVEFEAIPATKFTVTYTAKPENGTVVVKNGTADVITGAKVDKNTNLTLILTPAEGYKVKSAVAKVDGQEDKTLDLTANTTDKTFSATYKLEANVTFVVEFEALPVTLYTITYATPENGALEVKNGTDKVATGAKLAASTELTLIATPAEGYMLATLVATVDGKETKLAEEKKGSVTVTYPLAADVTFTATFKKEISGAVIDAQLASVRVYPNPFTNELRIAAHDVQNGLYYALFDALGNRCLAGYCEQEVSVNTQTLVPGIYFLRLTTNKGAEQVLKLVKK